MTSDFVVGSCSTSWILTFYFVIGSCGSWIQIFGCGTCLQYKHSDIDALSKYIPTGVETGFEGDMLVREYLHRKSVGAPKRRVIWEPMRSTDLGAFDARFCLQLLRAQGGMTPARRE